MSKGQIIKSNEKIPVWKEGKLRGVHEPLRVSICTVKGILRGVRKLTRASTFQCGIPTMKAGHIPVWLV